MGRYRPPAPKRSPYITPEGMERLRKELAYLWQDERPKVTKGVADAAAEGDRSENAEYIYGKKRLREIDRRIRFLSKRIEEVNVVSPGDRVDSEKVFFGAWLRIEDEEGGEFVLRIVGPDDFDMDKRYVSMDAPVGRALLGKRLDDEVTIRRPKGVTVWLILDLSYVGFDEG